MGYKLEQETIRQHQINRQFESKKKSTGLAFVLWWFTAGFAGHRFYLGYRRRWLMLFLGWATLFIWNFIDLFRITKMVEETNEKIEQEIAERIR